LPREGTVRVEDVMSQPVVTIEVADSCLEAVGRMHEARVRHLPVVDREGLLVGVVTDRDLRHHLFSPAVYKELGTVPTDSLLRAAPVTAIMSTSVVAVEPGASLMDAARLMLEENVGSLPVVHAGRVVGILTETDLLRHICRIDAGRQAACADIIVSYP